MFDSRLWNSILITVIFLLPYCVLMPIKKRKQKTEEAVKMVPNVSSCLHFKGYITDASHKCSSIIFRIMCELHTFLGLLYTSEQIKNVHSESPCI